MPVLGKSRGGWEGEKQGKESGTGDHGKLRFAMHEH